MLDYFFDTSVLVAYFKDEDERSAALIEGVIDGTATGAISAITVAELWADRRVTPEGRLQQQAVLHFLETIAVDNSVAQRGGVIRQIHDLKLPDALIAACCQTTQRVFLTKDPHFQRLFEANEIVGEVY